jgi:putative intracellular protease/amidase
MKPLAPRPVAQVRREFAAAEKKTAAACARRAALPAGSSRPRVTTANARWASAAEHRDRLLVELEQIEANERKGTR